MRKGGDKEEKKVTGRVRVQKLEGKGRRRKG